MIPSLLTNRFALSSSTAFLILRSMIFFRSRSLKDGFFICDISILLLMGLINSKDAVLLKVFAAVAECQRSEQVRIMSKR